MRNLCFSQTSWLIIHGKGNPQKLNLDTSVWIQQIILLKDREQPAEFGEKTAKQKIKLLKVDKKHLME